MTDNAAKVAMTVATLRISKLREGQYGYVIFRKDGTPAQRSPITYSTESLAKEEGQKLLQQTRDSAKPAKKSK